MEVFYVVFLNQNPTKRLNYDHRMSSIPASKNLVLNEIFLRKEVIHRQLPLPMPCYDLAPVTSLGLEPKLMDASSATHFHGLTGGVYKTRERIHRSEADLRLLAIPTS
jgi:hypothetical protein